MCVYKWKKWCPKLEAIVLSERLQVPGENSIMGISNGVVHCSVYCQFHFTLNTIITSFHIKPILLEWN